MLTIFLLVGLASSLTAQTSAGAAASGGRELRDDATTGDLFLKGAAGAVGSWLLAVPTYLLLDAHAGDRRVEGDAAYSPTANLGLIGASAIGSSVGVHVAGEVLGVEGSFWGALLGSGIASLPLLLGTNDPYLPYYGLTIGVALQDVGSLIGH